jgi:hypothetical protein
MDVAYREINFPKKGPKWGSAGSPFLLSGPKALPSGKEADLHVANLFHYLLVLFKIKIYLSLYIPPHSESVVGPCPAF